MTINIKNFLSDKSKLSKMGEFQNLKQIEGLEMSSVSADLYGNGRDDLSIEQKVKMEIFYLKNKSFFLDLKILFMTIYQIIIPKNIDE